jgi:hypothetical protein
MNGIIRKFVNKCLSLSRLGSKYVNRLVPSLIEAGRTISYLETYNSSQADLFHKEIRFSDKNLFMKTFEKVVRKIIPKLSLQKVKVAFDTTEDLTWSKSALGSRASAYEHELQSWQFLNLSIIEPYFIPLMSVPYTMFDNIDNLVIDLVGYLQSLPLKIDLILFDRGFYHAHLIDFFNSKKLPYLLLVPQNFAIKKYVEQTKDFQSFCHKMTYKKESSSWTTHTTIMVRRIDEKTCFSYATNRKPSLWLSLEYKKRWNIETGFRIHDEARIKSKSKILLVRFFYHLLGMVIVLVWRAEQTKRKVIFKRFLKEIEHIYELEMGVHPPPPL